MGVNDRAGYCYDVEKEKRRLRNVCSYLELHLPVYYDGDCERLDDVDNGEVVWVDEDNFC